MAKDNITKRSTVRGAVDALGNPRTLFWVAGLLLAIIVIGCSGSSGTDRVASVAAAEDLAPDFAFTLYQGKSKLGAATLDLSSLQGNYKHTT